MEYDILLSPTSAAALESLRKFDQKRIRDGMVEQLTSQPSVETRNRKRLRPGGPAEWEIRIGDYRVFYDVVEEGKQVKVAAIGYKKGSKLIILDQEHDL